MAKEALICGIICEWNPLHAGHCALMRHARAAGATHLVAVMSGNFVQRGEPAVFSKWARAEMGLRCGADLVVELPLPWALAPAEAFAFGGVSLLHDLGCVELLAFGSECGDAAALWSAAQAAGSPALREALRPTLAAGATFAKARQQAVRSLAGEQAAALFSSPNNILGIEYCKALQKLRSPIRPFTVRREGAAHDAPLEGVPQAAASSSQVREALRRGFSIGPLLPAPAAAVAMRELASGFAPVWPEAMEQAVLAQLRRMGPEDFSRLPDVSEGLEHRLYRAARQAVSLAGFWDAVKTKRYPLARIRRLTWSAYLGLTRDIPARPPYFRLLGMTEKGREILHLAKNRAKLPFLSHSSDVSRLDMPARHVFQLEETASDLYALASPHPRPCGLDRTFPVLRVAERPPACQ